MKKILILWFLAIGMANAQNIRIGVINGDTTTRPLTNLTALAWRNNNLYVVKPTGNTVKFLQNDSRLWVGDNNRVGIGTKAPSQAFEVVGNTKIGGSLQIGVGAGFLVSDANGLLSARNLVVGDIPWLGGLYYDATNPSGYVSASTVSGLYMPFTGGTFTGNVNYSPLFSQSINSDASTTSYQRFKWYVYNPTYAPTAGPESKLVLQTTRRSGTISIFNPIVINNGRVGIGISDLDNEPSKTLTVGGDMKLMGQPFLNTSLFNYDVGNYLKVASGGGIEGYNLGAEIANTYMPFTGGTFTAKTNNVATENTAYSASTAFQNSNSVGVVNQIYNNSNSTLSYSGLKLTTRSSLPTSWSILNVNAGLGLGDLVFGYGGSSTSSEMMKLTSDGRLGIGKNPTAAKLDVNGDIANTGNAYLSTSTGNVAIGGLSATEKLDVTGNIKASGTIIGSNLSGTNTGDNAANSLYSGLASSKLDVSVASTTYAPINNATLTTNVTSPKFTINGSGYIANGSDVSMGAGSTADIVTYNASGRVLFSTAGSVRFAITNAGNVGIGTIAPTSKFEVSGLAGFRYNDGKQADGKYMRSGSTGIALWDSVRHTDVMGLSSNYVQLSGGSFTGKTNNVATENTAYNATTAFQNANNVGVVNQIYNNSNSTLSYSGLKLTTRSSLPTSWSILNVNAGLGLGDLVFGYGGSSASSEKMRLNNSGHLGIGKNPQRALDVLGEISNDGNAYFATNSGNVGIGETNPTSKLHVNGRVSMAAGGLEYNIVNATTGFNSGMQFARSGYNNWFIGSTNNSESFHIGESLSSPSISFASGGRIGIGIASPTNLFSVNSSASPNLSQVKITANNAGSYSILNFSADNVATGYDVDYTGVWTPRSTSAAMIYKQAAKLNFMGNAGLTVGTSYAPIERLTIDLANGNVGIGNANPTSKLDVSGDFKISGTSSLAGNMAVGGTALGTRTLYVQTTTNDVNLESTTNRATGNNYAISGNAIGVGAGLNQGGFFTASGATSNFGVRIYNVLSGVNNYALYSDSPAQSYFQGNVGIGTALPTSQMHLKSANPIVRLEGSTTSGYLDFNDTRMNVHAGGGSMLLTAGNAERVRIDASGNVGIGTVAPNSLLHNFGSESNAITTISAATTLGEHYYIIASGASTYLVTLPTASVCSGRTYAIKTTTANKTISSFLNASGTSTTTLTAGTVIYVVSDGTNWQQF
jgi:hypothetical protein